MTLILKKWLGETQPPVPIAINPLQVESAETFRDDSGEERTELTLCSGRHVPITDPLDVYLTKWAVAMRDIQDVAEWSPEEDGSDDEFDPNDMSGCL